KLLGVQDAHASVYNAKGIDVKELTEHKNSNENLSVKSYKNAEEIDPKSFFGIECDIVIPAALGSQITEDNADIIKADIVAEGANGPVTSKGEEILLGNGIAVIPDFLCNSGGVIGSYF